MTEHSFDDAFYLCQTGNDILDITLPGINFLYGENKQTYPSTGAFSLFLPSGDFTVSVVARDTPGTYEPRNFTFTASEEGAVVELALSRA